MQKTALLSIAVVASLVTAAIAQSAPEPEPAWRASALALVPAGYVAGEAYRTTDMTGYLAVYPAGANDPKSPASVFAARQVLVIKLDKDERRALSAELKPRSDATRGKRDTTMTDPDGQESEFAKSHAELAAKRAALPDGTEPCNLGAWSEDRDPKGLNVRAEPSVKSRVLGTLPPPYRLKMAGSENTPEDGWLTEFRVIGFKDGWFLIEGATPPGKEYEDEKKYPRNAPKPYSGRGWVAANKVGANYANGGTRMGGLFQAPFADAKWTPAQRKLGGPLDTDGGPKRLLACSGYWGLVESQDGVRGWWRSLCSSQVTNCS
ncbi:SH3 domain-containing protein [Bradyrhizobium sp. AUGA SZCCT0177]|uniref:SH3 domain-containing protein n=1 Tax=Bradyrhizobium sp. AUGA SZCCT0177 TaxID=2807665 RepID=UPI001BA63432|nr:SH3 domain-containing protein [Bradyrhizobium sp. AUGA SZCCT0177]MBR1282696.1 SH3 domain-containing protein [Bradyrhizobium sp. AUGA SZCCT0177]